MKKRKSYAIFINVKREMDNYYSFVDLFAGAGGLSKGLEQAGFSPCFANEINPVCAETYKRNRSMSNDQVFVGDIKDLNVHFQEYSKHVKDCFMVCGGPPCQGFSMANRQRVIDDPRNRLYLEYLKFLQKTKPVFFIMENVKGMLQRKYEILEDFHSMLGSEYNISLRLLNAKDFSVPQSRERLIFIGNRAGVDGEEIFDRLYSFPQTKYVLKDAISDLPELKPNRIKNRSDIQNEEVGFFERYYDYPPSCFRDYINSGRKVEKIYNHKNRFNNDRDIEIYSRLKPGENSLAESIADIMPYSSRNDIFKDKYFKLDGNQVCKTITSHMKYDCNMYIHPWQPRGLSPREAARIQTFPDDYIFYGAQNSWYMQIGNAVPVKLAESIGRAIHAFC